MSADTYHRHLTDDQRLDYLPNITFRGPAQLDVTWT